MECADDNSRAKEPVFADCATILDLLGVPENTLRELACKLVVAAHKLGDKPQSKCVYLFSDVKAWVASRPAPEWVERWQRNKASRTAAAKET